ncbi:MAG: [Fe-S]-binding protein [Candidatus Latescibacterota bacterium]|nr:MAG: [Fe-S]-binding protein [Candidatus Latescibacteria bacterium 4484_107]RKY67544.1 MAG: [Fe-S]-binding protein [Candidatus Latescibacterota bacterium]
MNGYPKMIRIRQRFEAPVVRDTARKVREELGALELRRRIEPGDTVAIPAGSRGITDIVTILKTVAEHLREIGARPFIVPAMGSHGGGTAEGQQEVLRHIGITEARMGVPIRASMEVVKIGETPEGFPVHLDRHAAQADHIAVINRVKPHTEFYGAVESGLLKMIAIGLGKRQGAEIYHKVAVKHPFSEVAQAVARVVFRERSVLFGLGVVENGYEQTARIQAAGPEGLIALDKALLREAIRLMPRLPFDEIDVLIVDEMGKNISGAGMDTGVIGRKSWAFHRGMEEKPSITRIFVRDLTEASAGNACGIGLADFTTQRLVAKIDMEVSRLNALTSTRPRGVMIPMAFDTDREAVDTALATAGVMDPREARVVWIKNTLEIAEMAVSEAFIPEMEGRANLKALTEPGEMRFDGEGNLVHL